MKRMSVNTHNNTYDIFIKKGILHNVGSFIESFIKNKKVIIITDTNVNRLYGEYLMKNMRKYTSSIFKIVINAGEDSKSFDTLKQIYDKLLSFHVNRTDIIIAFGGGVVGDLAGFAASTYMRGIHFIQIPTTLLSQIDSSIGGKVAINHPKGKNLIGSFYHPKSVIIDPDLLDTLNNKFLYDGFGEVIKYSLIKDKYLYNTLIRINNKIDIFNHIEDIIYNCCKIKKDIVEKDEKDQGIRMLLNFGHTLGHAIEKYYAYKSYTHGEAIAIGMYNITKVSEDICITKKGTSKLILDILNKYNLPYDMPTNNIEKLFDFIRLDKKNSGTNINLVFIKEVGKGTLQQLDIKEFQKLLTVNLKG
ncbi:3-dehydroquinate synthase [Clostridiisalibacter paucivorans]|uniref:3-dehydroquinate synthase n=1 Tax=Clostridiisalibacter paucivorans TaxID=408753 RepID=UPI00047CA42B|nr:3-dehydroquinate synthase [Clostridiisalibacter paucivorans]